MLEAIRQERPSAKLYHAPYCEMFGSAPTSTVEPGELVEIKLKHDIRTLDRFDPHTPLGKAWKEAIQ